MSDVTVARFVAASALPVILKSLIGNAEARSFLRTPVGADDVARTEWREGEAPQARRPYMMRPEAPALMRLVPHVDTGTMAHIDAAIRPLWLFGLVISSSGAHALQVNDLGLAAACTRADDQLSETAARRFNGPDEADERPRDRVVLDRLARAALAEISSAPARYRRGMLGSVGLQLSRLDQDLRARLLAAAGGTLKENTSTLDPVNLVCALLRVPIDGLDPEVSRRVDTAIVVLDRLITSGGIGEVRPFWDALDRDVRAATERSAADNGLLIEEATESIDAVRIKTAIDRIDIMKGHHAPPLVHAAIGALAALYKSAFGGWHWTSRNPSSDVKGQRPSYSGETLDFVRTGAELYGLAVTAAAVREVISPSRHVKVANRTR